MKVAVIGSGVAGLAAARALSAAKDVGHVTVFEKSTWLGGHAHTVDVCLPGENQDQHFGVDTGFLVFNERTYPALIALFASLGVDTAKSEMSFSVQAKQRQGSGQGALQSGLEWSGSSLNSLFAQRSNLVNPAFWNMLRELLRFNRLATALIQRDDLLPLQQSLNGFLREHQFSAEFTNWYLLPMVACIWSCPTSQMLRFPALSLIRFCHNHGLLQVFNRPQWWTVRGGSRCYVDKIAAGLQDVRLGQAVRSIVRHPALPCDGVTVATDAGSETFDKVVIATHSDQALDLLAHPHTAEQKTLGAIRYQDNRAVLHTDTSVLPKRRAAWAAWNHEFVANREPGADPEVCLHYLINKLQPLPTRKPVLVSLNPIGQIAPELVKGEYHYAHPVFDLAATKAQRQLPWIQGLQHTYFCGAWQGYGFHEDGYKSGLDAAQLLLTQARRNPHGSTT